MKLSAFFLATLLLLLSACGKDKESIDIGSGVKIEKVDGVVKMIKTAWIGDGTGTKNWKTEDLLPPKEDGGEQWVTIHKKKDEYLALITYKNGGVIFKTSSGAQGPGRAYYEHNNTGFLGEDIVSFRLHENFEQLTGRQTSGVAYCVFDPDDESDAERCGMKQTTTSTVVQQGP